jgi:hypothetical protein
MARTGSRYRVPTQNMKSSDINNELAKIDRDIRGKSYLKADLPTDGSLLIAVCSDEAGGATGVFFDGTQWRRFQDLAVVS